MKTLILLTDFGGKKKGERIAPDAATGGNLIRRKIAKIDLAKKSTKSPKE